MNSSYLPPLSLKPARSTYIVFFLDRSLPPVTGWLGFAEPLRSGLSLLSRTLPESPSCAPKSSHLSVSLLPALSIPSPEPPDPPVRVSQTVLHTPPVTVGKGHVVLSGSECSSPSFSLPDPATLFLKLFFRQARLPPALPKPPPKPPPDLRMCSRPPYSRISPIAAALYSKNCSAAALHSNLMSFTCLDLCFDVMLGQDLFNSGVSDKQEWFIGDVSISPVVLVVVRILATVPSWPIYGIEWAWPIKLVRLWPSSTEPKSSPNHFGAPSDSCVSLPCDLFQGPNAGMFSSPIVWESFIISPSSVGMERSLSSSSLLRERTFPPCSLSMKEFYLPDSMPVNFVDLVTVLFSCVVVCMSPEETTELILVMLGGEDWLSKSRSKVTIFQQSGFAVKCLSMHSSYGSYPLSNSFGVLSISLVLMLCCSFQRGCFIPSSCILKV
uniref:Uncharacterized protein n=1 Tax=Noccaea caerulescens TaxID=107243 RepID=A0A1J3GEV4_NOCCA